MSRESDHISLEGLDRSLGGEIEGKFEIFIAPSLMFVVMVTSLEVVRNCTRREATVGYSGQAKGYDG